MIELVELTSEVFEAEADASFGLVPIEQRDSWMEYEATIPGRSIWGFFRIEEEGRALGYVAFADYQTHGYHFLRSHHGPMWLSAPDAAEEERLLSGLADAIRRRDRRILFARLAVEHDVACCRETLSTVPYDATVIIDLSGGDEDILSRMKPRGRRDVRKSIREAPITCADETDRAMKDFSEYYPVMVETSERDGFAPAPISDYQDMLRLLGKEHCRVFAGRREDGSLVNWSIVTISSGRAVRYYAASLNGTMRLHVSDRLVYFEACELSRMGCKDYDLMGIGSELSPSLMGLNEFKCKFSKEVAHVAPDRDLVVRGLQYGALVKAKELRSKLRK